MLALNCAAQQATIYNVNKDNGLSSNHVYCLLVDRLGYLWIGTTKGLYRYNGYSYAKYDYSNGLPNIDIWALYQDKSGKIWPLTIAHEIGYIKNNIYKRVRKSNNFINSELYPNYLIEYNGKILFSSASYSAKEHAYGLIANDTLNSIVFGFEDTSLYKAASFLLFSPYVVRPVDSHMYLYEFDNFANTSPRSYPTPDTIVKVPYNLGDSLKLSYSNMTFANRYIIARSMTSNTVRIFDIKTLKHHTINLKEFYTGDIYHTYSYNNLLHCLGNNRLIIIDSNLSVVYNKTIDEVYPSLSLSGNSNTFFMNHNFWGKLLTTNNSGLYIKFHERTAMIKQDLQLGKYQYAGMANDSTGYWWNSENNTLALVCNARIISKTILPGIQGLKRIVRYNDHYSLLLGGVVKWLYNNKVAQPFEHQVQKNVIPGSRGSGYYYASDIYVTNKNTLYILGIGMIGVYKITLDKNNKDTAITNYILSKFEGVAGNDKNKIVICYSHGKILIIQDEQKMLLDARSLEILGLNGIEKTFADDYGNIFIKDHSKLMVYNLHTRRSKRLFSNYVLEGAIVDLYKNRLSIAGGFGVISTNVIGAGKLSGTIVYPNTKKIYYNYVKSAQFTAKNILLNTERGIYLIDLASTGNTDGLLTGSCQFIVTHQNELSKLFNNDTISVGQLTTSIGIDVIKPTGTGKLHITYSLDGIQHSNTDLQIVLPRLTVDRYHRILVRASDDSWESTPVVFYVYVEPHWWQKSNAQNILIALSIILISGIIYLVIISTRRIINRSNDRKNQRRELELKSIYSQINPHFIFNSLSTAQYFVKKNRNKEAYEHINQFSDLLRAYIKSSRDKYISIAEELDNLENYLQLQLTRFEDKFEYKFIVDPVINARIIKIPSLLLQPLVENALNHGIFHSSKKGLLIVSFSLDDQDNLICKVDDNGIGRQRSKELRSETIRKTDSYGNILIKELIDTFNKYETIKIELEYIDKTLPETGTTVIIRIMNYNHAQ